MMKNRAIVAVIDAAHARIFTYGEGDETGPRLGAEQAMVSPGRQGHGQFADKQAQMPGTVGTGGQPGASHAGGHGTADDHRTDYLAELDARFAKDIVAAIATRAKGEDTTHVIVVAAPKMLGTLRTETAALTKQGIALTELDSNLAHLTLPQIQDYLSKQQLIGPRLRDPSVHGAAPGQRA